MSHMRGPSKDRLERYNELTPQKLWYAKTTVALISLVPTITVIAYDLYKMGNPSMGIGHAFKDRCIF
ncbi:GT-D fold domain-containing glycosyltransferase [Polynucleobacter sp. MG-28-Ekke-A2]|uniref:GT-D fold domain-containing glycosyltransferase n=1 Tax=Polynucleobacter sp. MG-28-Ekke-A2 TaxID=3108276 RepID=UPI003A5997F1